MNRVLGPDADPARTVRRAGRLQPLAEETLLRAGLAEPGGGLTGPQPRYALTAVAYLFLSSHNFRALPKSRAKSGGSHCFERSTAKDFSRPS